MLEIKARLESAFRNRPDLQRPLVSLSYAQSLDGSLTVRRGQPTPLSGPESTLFTHRLRSQHDAILIGIGTLLADDPLLSARLPGAASPQPVVLDSRLRTPPESRLLTHNPKPAWIACLDPVDPARRLMLERQGARMLALPAASDGRVDLLALLDGLAALGVTRLMVEGGAAVISAFLAQGLADLLILTVAPVLLGGLPAVEVPLGQVVEGKLHAPRLNEVEYHRLEDDWIVIGGLR